MKLVQGLGRQIVLSMVAASLSAVAVSIIGMYLFYSVVMEFAPQWLPRALSHDEMRLPSGIEWLAMASVSAVGAWLAFRAALRLTRRILAPLSSVAGSARQIAQGDLSARAAVNDRSLGEAALLVDDFNRMASNLETAAGNIAHWNAMIAHELRTPVTILRGRLQGMADGVFQPEPAMFRSLLTQVDGLARLVEDLRTVSLVDTGHLQLVMRRVELRGELETVVSLMEQTLTQAGFTLDVSLDQGMCDLDPARIRQAVLALLDNAHRYARPARLTVCLKIEPFHVAITVADEGPGLPDAFVSDAFLPFQCHWVEGSEVRGSGLGLAVVSAIAQAHGGDAVYEKRNGGACFTIRMRRYHPVAQGEGGGAARRATLQ